MTENFDSAFLEEKAVTGPAKRTTGDGVTPTTPNETQDKKEVAPIVLVNGPNHTILDDNGDLEIRNKNDGFGIHISEGGDIGIYCGTGANGKNLSGRIIINAPKGGIEKYGGALLSEYTADDKDQVQGEGSKTTAQSGKGGIARSDMIYGNWMVEVKGGDIGFNATNITVRADDVLSLIGGEVIVQGGPNAGGDIKLQSGNLTTTASLQTVAISSQKMTVGVGEETALVFDPRGSRNIITAGHLNVKSMGDLKVNTLGCASMHFAGNPIPTGGVPLIKKRKTSLNVGTKLGNIGISTKVGSISMGAGGFGDLTGLLPGSVNIKAKVDVKVNGTLIYLN